jgi:hypothetical protein
MVGGHEKQSESNTTSTSSSASALASAVSADWLIAPSLRNVRVDAQYDGINEEQKQWIRQLQEELAEFNCFWYRTLPALASRVRNVLRTSKKVSMTPIDHMNQQAVATTYVREAIWPGNKSFHRVGISGGMIKKFVSDDTKKGCNTCWCGLKVILGGNDTSNHKQQVLITEGKFHARVVWAVSR